MVAAVAVLRITTRSSLRTSSGTHGASSSSSRQDKCAELGTAGSNWNFSESLRRSHPVEITPSKLVEWICMAMQVVVPRAPRAHPRLSLAFWRGRPSTLASLLFGSMDDGVEWLRKPWNLVAP